jgi:predicted permease
MTDWRRYVRSHLPPLTTSAERESEIVEELAIQLEATYERARASGSTDDEAVARAEAEVPDWQALSRSLARIERAVIAAPPIDGPGGVMNGIATDARLAWRGLRRTPAFTAVSIATLAVGLGMAAAAFAVLNAVLLEPLRFRDPERLVLVHATVPPNGRDTNEITYLDAADLARETSAFESVGVVIPYEGTATSLDPPERVRGLELSPARLETLGVRPALGRGFTAEEGQSGEPSVVMLGHGFWRRLGSRADIIGATLVLDEVPHTVVGVMPENFRVEVFSIADHVYRPVRPNHFAAGTRAFRAFRAIAKLQPGVSIEAAASVAATVGDRLASQYPDTNRGRTFTLRPLHEDITGTSRPVLMLVAGLAAVVLLIAGVNLINLLLARSVARAREVAVRSALGARAWRLVRPALLEAMWLTVLGAGGALLIAQGIVTLLKTLPGIDLPRLAEVDLEWRAIAVLAGVALAAMGAVGGVPFLMHRRLHDTTSLKTGHETAGPGERRLRSALVSAQAALAFLLVAATVLLTISLQRVLSLPTGFDPGVVTMRISVPAARYQTREETQRFFAAVVDDLAAQAGVQKAGFTWLLPLNGSAGSSMTVQGREQVPAAERPDVGWVWADPGYFDAIGIPIVRGRGFTAADLETKTHVTLVNETLARLHFAGEDPIGKRVYFGRVPAAGVPEWHEIIGVVGDTRHRTLEREPDARAYDLFGQHWDRTISLAVRTTEPAAATAALVRSVLARHDPRLAVFEVQTTDEIVDTAVATRRLMLWLVGAFAVAGFGVALLGVYGIVACMVAERQREIGVRVALGATAANIHRLVMAHGLTLVTIGLAAGIAAAIALRRAIESQLFGIEPTNGPVLTAVAMALLLSAAVPCFIVSRRAARIDPVRTLRSE